MERLFICSFFLPGALATVAFLLFLFGLRLPRWLFRITEALVVLGLPIFFLAMNDMELKNNCCDDSAFFSPDHRASAYVIILLSMIAYFVASYREELFPPIPEVIMNCVLLIGIAMNSVMIVHHDSPLWYFFNASIILLFLMALAKNHRRFVEISNGGESRNMLERICWLILRMRPLAKFPLLLLLCLPLLVVIAAVLMLFGQRPDAMIRAFTDTYKHGLSQLDHQCKGVVCEGHYLCTIAARGHASIVKPQRIGYRHGEMVICNRQLLVSNAFEEVMLTTLPWLHRPIRSAYNRIGRSIHRHYHLFEHKWISDLVYLAMKPAEWSFLFVLYCTDVKPENRIAKQYVNKRDQP